MCDGIMAKEVKKQACRLICGFPQGLSKIKIMAMFQAYDDCHGMEECYMKRQYKQKMAFLLVFVMVFSLLGGYQGGKQAEAAAGKIRFGAIHWEDDSRTAYTFPGAEVDLAQDQHLFSISVTNGGSFTVPEFTNLGEGVRITGLRKATNDGNRNAFVSEVKAGDELVQMTYFGYVNTESVQNFLRGLVFHRNTDDLEEEHSITALVNDAQLEDDMGAMALNGVMHYYEYRPYKKTDQDTWYDAYKDAKQATFYGLNGYLATITNDLEQDYVYKFFNYVNGANENNREAYLRAWVGGMRTNTDKIGNAWDQNEVDPGVIDPGDKNNQWGQVAKTWYWMCGPEAGQSFYMTNDGGTQNAGGEDGCDIPYAAWGGAEPNNNYSEAMGVDPTARQEYALEYGYYEEGYWNDYSPYNISREDYGIAGYLIEYSPYDNDKEQGGQTEEEENPSISTERVVTGLEGEGSTGTVKPSASPGTPTKAPQQKVLIGGNIIIENQNKDKDGNDVVEVGTVLTANIKGVTPSGSHDTLTYQWYEKGEDGKLTPITGATYKNYVVTKDTIDKDLVVIATGHKNKSGTITYYGDVDSDPYNTKRTSADLGMEEGDDGTISITVNPTDEDTIYAIKDDEGNVLKVTTVDGNKDPLEEDQVDGYPGYFQGTDGGTITFTGLEKGKTYIVHEIKRKKDGNGGNGENEDVVSPPIDKDDVKTDYDDKGTTDKKDDKTSIIIDPADPEYVYAILKKRPDGSYEEISVSKDTDGNYKPDPDGKDKWTSGGEDRVVFKELDPGETYKVVAKSKDGSSVTDVTPGNITGGSDDIKTPTEPLKQQGTQPTAAPKPTPKPGTGSTTFTKKEQDAANKFIKDHMTDPNNKVITTVTDLTRDSIVNGEADWKKLSAKEKQAVNAKLKASGSKYTYEQLLKMAKAYKVPGFDVIKYMKKNTKAKVKLIKCKGATISCTTTNAKVGTINKKGVIKAKKVGKARLTLTAVKGKYTSRVVINLRVKKKFKNAKEIKKLNTKAIKTPTALIAKQRRLGKSSKIKVYDLEKGSKVTYTPINKKILTINKKGKYKGLKKGKTLVRTKVEQNNKIYWLYVYVTIY